MRLAPLLALSVAAVTLAALASPADAQNRRVYRGQQTERITIIDENGRTRTRITVQAAQLSRRRHRGSAGRAQVHGLRAGADLLVARADQLMGSERHASLAAADAVRAAGLFAVFVLVTRAAALRRELLHLAQ